MSEIYNIGMRMKLNMFPEENWHQLNIYQRTRSRQKSHPLNKRIKEGSPYIYTSMKEDSHIRNYGHTSHSQKQQSSQQV